VLVVRQGEKGSICYSKKISMSNSLKENGSLTRISCTKESLVNVKNLNVIDTTGANEVYTAAFASKYFENGGKVIDCLKFANAAWLCAASRFGSGEDCVP
jgi:sugar/nucleoside kinase (ribokinase family)